MGSIFFIILKAFILFVVTILFVWFFLVFLLILFFGSKEVLLSLLRNKDETLSSFMSANALFLRLPGTVHCRLVQ